MDDAQLLAFRAGDPAAVRTLYEQYGRLVYTVALRVLRDPGLAEDATQQAFVQAWRAAASYDTGRDIAPWLATIAHRAAIDLARKEYGRRYDSLDDPDSTPAATLAVPDGTDDAYQVWTVRAAVDALPSDEGDIVRLQHLQGYSHSEIATKLAIPIGTVKSRSARAHRRLSERLAHLRENSS
ncbi:MAG: RNA polymerase sigma factor [Sporichthyaceae bacterium]